MPPLLQSETWWRDPPLSNRYFRGLSDEDLSLSTQHPYCAWQGVNAQRAQREIRRRKAKGVHPMVGINVIPMQADDGFVLSKEQARMCVRALAPHWVGLSIKIAIHERCEPYPHIYGTSFKTLQAIVEYRNSLAQLEQVVDVLRVFTDLSPEIDQNAFLPFKQGGDGIIAAYFGPIECEAYKRRLVLAWESIPLKGDTLAPMTLHS